MKKLHLLILVLALGMLFVGCEKEEDDNGSDKVEANGLSPEINDFLSEGIIEDMESLGMIINTGGNPPDIQDIFNASPFVLDSSNIASDYPGMQFSDFRFKFYDQNNDDLTVKLDYINGPENGSGLGSFIVGEGNKFTVVSEVTVVVYSDTASVAMVLSGELASDGINDFVYANFMIENNGGSYFIENGEGRVIYDEDGFSEKVESLEGTTYKKENATVSGK